MVIIFPKRLSPLSTEKLVKIGGDRFNRFT